MRFEATPLAGAYLVRPDRREDDRGHFARTYCRDTFRERGLADCGLQCSTSYNRRRGTLRGLHLQRPPHIENKLVRCTRGAVFDVAVDLRPGSPTRGRWHGVALDPGNGLAFYIPSGFAHGFLTLADDSEVYYQMAEPYVPEAAAGVRWDDPDLAIAWPFPPLVLSEADRRLPALREAEGL